jgi:hypothetical protein
MGKLMNNNLHNTHAHSSDGFILLRSLIFSAAIIALLSAALSIMIALLRQSSGIKAQAEKIIADRNAAVYNELHER